MMKWICISAILTVFTVNSCSNNAHFEKYHDQVIKKLKKERPNEWILETPSSEFLLLESAWLKNAIAVLEKFQSVGLTRQNQLKAEQTSRQMIHLLENFEKFSTDPSLYNIGGYIHRLLSNNRQPISYKLDSINEVLQQGKIYYENGKANLIAPEIGKAKLSVQKQILTLQLLKKNLVDSILSAPVKPVFKQEIQSNLEGCSLAIKDYIAFCEGIWLEDFDKKIKGKSFSN